MRTIENEIIIIIGNKLTRDIIWHWMAMKNISHNLRLIGYISIMDQLFLGSFKPKIYIGVGCPIHSSIFSLHCLGFDTVWEQLLQLLEHLVDGDLVR